jgi:ABC-2 type transport system ATP-binding protein
MHPADRDAARAVLERELGVEVRTQADPAALDANVESPALATRALTALDAADLRLAQFSLGQPTLDEVFLALTGHHADGPATAGAATTEEDAA